MFKKDLTRRQFVKTAGAGIAALGMMGQIPSLAWAAKNYTFGSASAAGSWYPLAVAMAKVINDNVPGYNVTGVTTPGASRENILRIDRKEMEIGWSSANILYKGYNGLKPFKAKQKVTGWFAAYPGLFTIAVRKGSGITDISQLKGKKVALGTPGSQTMMDNVNLIFKNCGLNADKDLKPEYIRFPDAVQKMIDGHIDACSYFMGIGVPGYVQLADSTDVVFLPIPAAAQPKILKQDPAYFIGEIPAGTYKGQDKAVAAAGMAYTVACGPFLSDEFMYNATKAVFENLSFIASASANFKRTSLANVYKGMPIPVHPGAAKYFKEKGITP
ncbi:MAG: TAXI family TRAP transporter solute-binding subunit [Desulfarculaceae bacterium]|nr:TAXI family TRAP transporter solute-binding subunit [Desulfarculaceae bacterium]MCF8071566.1 TAXI family TRAP transporter solute-binding subunit [Desulfarculaceae bacterium]MCF8102381.1 TAXI family TRAP transporter solute-binding subunit [Desulfarculaceae bacterium]MCF8114845.1 TAXI family TRAP transporter solute-binding subunit [Desulfarculaceae bacterium]